MQNARPIWIVTCHEQVVAAFTIRRQLVAFLAEAAERYGDDLAILRMPDGKPCNKAFFEPGDLMQENRRRERRRAMVDTLSI
jgi:hypothetical protein